MIFLSENFQFLMVKLSVYLNSHVFVMFPVNHQVAEPPEPVQEK